MKLQFDPLNKKGPLGFMVMPLGLLMLGVQILQYEAVQRAIGFIAAWDCCYIRDRSFLNQMFTALG